MADKRISQLIERTDIANNDVLPIVASGATTTNKVTISTIQDWMQDNLDVGVTSVGLSVPSAFTVSGSPVTTSGNITISGAGTTAQYIRGDGSLADFPSSIGGGGASVSYYLNGSVNQGTIGGVAYRELSKSPILGSGTDFTINADGYIASFITDAGDPSLLEIPGGNWNFETYFQASSGGGTPTFYVELYKVSSGGTATLIATSSGSPELIAFGTNTTPYFSSLAVPTTTLALTDRLAIRYYVVHAGRTITLHTENNTLCQIITTFTTGLTALNGLTAQVQNFATGTSGTDFNISSASTTHTFNLPDASASNRGVVTTGTQTIAGIKTFTSTIRADVSVLLAQAGTALPTDLRNISGTGLTSSGSNGFGFNSGNNIYFSGSDKGGGIISFSNTGNRTYTLQNASGTLAFTSDLGGYLPLTGGTLTGALNGTSAIFSGDLQSGTRLIAAASSQSLILTPNSGGTTNRVESVGTLPLALVSAAAITMAAGGTTPQITLATTGAVTLIGALNGTSASFSGNVGIGTTASTSALTVNGQVNVVNLGVQGFYQARTSDTAGAGVFGGNSFVLRNGAISEDLCFDVFNRSTSVWYTPLRFTNSTGAATFSSSVTAGGLLSTSYGIARILVTSTTNSENAGFRLSARNSSGTAKTSGLYFVSGTTTANTFLSLSANDNDYQLNVLENGNVGIGTASPGQKLVVQEAGDAFIQVRNNTAGQNLFLGALSGEARINNDNATPLTMWVNGSERMRITSAGNVGIGTASPLARLEITSNSPASAEVQRWSYNVANPDFSLRLRQDVSSGLVKHVFDVVNDATTYSNNLVLTNGNVGIGTTGAINAASGWTNFVVNGSDRGLIGVKSNEVDFGAMYGSTASNAFVIQAYGTSNAGSMAFLTASTERMRITSGGIVAVGKQDGTFGNDGHALFPNGQVSHVVSNDAILFLNRKGSDGIIQYFYKDSGIVGSIAVTAVLTTYNTTSDYRLKEDLQEFNGLEKVQAIKVYDYKWKSEESRMNGVLAHELAEVLPYAVTGEKDEQDEKGNDKMQGVDYSKIVPVLIKAIQELKAEIDSLKTK